VHFCSKAHQPANPFGDSYQEHPTSDTTNASFKNETSILSVTINVYNLILYNNSYRYKLF
jgi:hypothetical protein